MDRHPGGVGQCRAGPGAAVVRLGPAATRSGAGRGAPAQPDPGGPHRTYLRQLSATWSASRCGWPTCRPICRRRRWRSRTDASTSTARSTASASRGPLWVDLTAGRLVQGGSTITQQVAKNLFLTNARTLRRKVQELLLTLWLEQTFTKKEILEIWLNRVYLGSGAWGMDAAARIYFGVSARKVTLWQAAVLAGLPRAPSRFNPRVDPSRRRRAGARGAGRHGRDRRDQARRRRRRRRRRSSSRRHPPRRRLFRRLGGRAGRSRRCRPAPTRCCAPRWIRVCKQWSRRSWRRCWTALARPPCEPGRGGGAGRRHRRRARHGGRPRL